MASLEIENAQMGDTGQSRRSSAYWERGAREGDHGCERIQNIKEGVKDHFAPPKVTRCFSRKVETLTQIGTV